MNISKYRLYSANAGQQVIDEVDEFLNVLNTLNRYDDVVNFIKNKFGEIEEQKVIEFPELNKQVEIVYKEDAVEFFAAKDWQQYFGRGWKKLSKKMQIKRPN